MFLLFSLLVRGSVHQVDGKWEFVDTVQTSFPAVGWMNSVQNVTGISNSWYLTVIIRLGRPENWNQSFLFQRDSILCCWFIGRYSYCQWDLHPFYKHLWWKEAEWPCKEFVFLLTSFRFKKSWMRLWSGRRRSLHKEILVIGDIANILICKSMVYMMDIWWRIRTSLREYVPVL